MVDTSNQIPPLDYRTHYERWVVPYYARVLQSVETKPGCWNYLDVGVFRHEDDVQVGSYRRNYSTMFDTFLPFVGADGKWYALYSPDYTLTRVMSLPDCSDIGGEEPSAWGFCPTSYCAIRSYWRENTDRSLPADQLTWKVRYAPFALVSGCVWGDDSSDKLEWLDISRAHEGILVRSAKFGYHELPEGLDIRDLEFWGNESFSVNDPRHFLEATLTLPSVTRVDLDEEENPESS